MKTLIIFVVAFSAMMFLGCSIDSQIETETVAKDISAARPEFHNVVFESQGKLEIVEAVKCKELDLEQVTLKGFSKIQNLGKYEMVASYCTDFKEQRIGNGVLMTERGSKLYFSYQESGFDRLGFYILYQFEGGTKEYENARGELKVYMHEEFVGVTGAYKASGDGFIWL